MPDFEKLKAKHALTDPVDSFEFEGETWHYRVPRSFGLYEKVQERGPQFAASVKRNPKLKAYHHLTEKELLNANLVAGFIVKGPDDPSPEFSDGKVLEMAEGWGTFLVRLADALAERLNPILYGETEALEAAKNASGATLSGTDTSGSPAEEPSEESTRQGGASESG